MRNFAYAKFRENKILANGEITLSFTEIGKSCPSREFYRRKYVFYAIRKNKILAKIKQKTILKRQLIIITLLLFDEICPPNILNY